MANRPELIELPELVILLFSSYLSYGDLKNLRMTCKRLKEIIDQRKFRTLHLFIKINPFERELFHTSQRISYANTLRIPKLDVFRSIKFKRQFSGLFKLTICDAFKKGRYSENYRILDLNDLNCFKELVHLQLDRFVIEYGILNLKKLKIVYFENTTRDTSIFQLDCPQLKVLGLGHESDPRKTPHLTPETANSIENLHVKCRTRKAYMQYMYSKLKNLAIICFKNRKELEMFLPALIERKVSLSLLKAIQLQNVFNFYERGVLFRNLANLKSRPEMRHIEIWINETVMDRPALIEMFDLLGQIVPDNQSKSLFFCHLTQSFLFSYLEGALLRHFKRSPILHSLLPCVHTLLLWSKEDVQLSKQLIGNLKNLKYLTIGKEVELDEQFFEGILKTCRKISKLSILGPCLKQQQLSQISNHLPNVRELTFGGSFLLGNYNLDFVIKFKRLSLVCFGFNIEKETMHLLLKNGQHDPDFHLELFGKQNIWVFRQRNEIIRGSKSSGFYEHSSNKKTKFDSIDDLIEHYYLNDLFNTPFSSD